MARLETNRSGEMEVFARVVQYGGLSAAARTLRMTPSAVSKLLTRLEERLGARLINRSTRKLQLTPEGAAFYDRSLRVLADIDEAEREAAAGSSPRGRVRVNSSVPFGVHQLLPLVPDFLAEHPEVTLDLVLTDQVVDLLEERCDVALRVGPMRPSQLMARKLGQSRMAVVAAPAYLARHGTPTTLEALEGHNRIGFNFARSFEEWPFLVDGAIQTVPACGDVQVGDGESARRLAVAGVGLARLGVFHVAEDLAAGRLQAVLEPLNPGDHEDIHAVFMGQGGHLPARVRAFVDFLAERVKLAAA
ncbi:LysR family transcriptional regulator [Caulobacter sp. 17J65-9]|uniref:LysR family transcriptional regulator n=1 Tax=Caulobacter sp. 17J65-9 TaxID=2709382 RepID=UPI0013C9CE2B|nr:LysR family transcriptional regulator [Caulobacter sp. 17J65-9]NEX93184.1 LysR family transcriptional regulator [Caulobacter sp. 17J65-9]